MSRVDSTRLVMHHDPLVAEWAGRVLCTNFVPPFVAVGLMIKDRLAAAVVFNGYTGPTIEASVAVIDRKAVTRKTLRQLFTYPFEQLNCVRVTARTRAGQTKTRDLIKRLGFIQEGLMRSYYGDDDAVIYGMLRHECKWLERNHG